MKTNYQITTKSGVRHDITWHNLPSSLLSALESLRGARAITVHARHDLTLGTKGGIKKTNPLVEGADVQGEKLFGYNGLTNVSYGNCVRNWLRREGERVGGERGEFLVNESKTWTPKRRVWGEAKDGQRHIVEHTDKDGEHTVYVTLITWRREGSLYHEYRDVNGKVLSQDEIAPHLYAKSGGTPTVELSDGSREEIPFYVRTITLDKVADVRGIELADTESLTELAEITS
jgi:hypothetical protein